MKFVRRKIPLNLNKYFTPLDCDHAPLIEMIVQPLLELVALLLNRTFCCAAIEREYR